MRADMAEDMGEDDEEETAWKQRAVTSRPSAPAIRSLTCRATRNFYSSRANSRISRASSRTLPASRGTSPRAAETSHASRGTSPAEPAELRAAIRKATPRRLPAPMRMAASNAPALLHHRRRPARRRRRPPPLQAHQGHGAERLRRPGRPFSAASTPSSSPRSAQRHGTGRTGRRRRRSARSAPRRGIILAREARGRNRGHRNLARTLGTS